VKGTLLVHLRAFVVRDFGDAGWERLVAQVPPADRALLDGLLLVGGWIPVGVWNRAVQVFLTNNYADPAGAMAEVARFVADSDLHSIFRLVLKVGAPDFILGRTQSIYNRYFEAGTFVPKKIAARHWVASLTAPRDEEQGPGVFSCDAGISAWLKHALQLSGVQPTVVHSRCRFSRAPSCEYDLKW
jgi:hypothetical protein